MRSLYAHVNVQTAAAPSFIRRGDWCGLRSCALNLQSVLTSEAGQGLETTRLTGGGSRPSATQARGTHDPQLLKTTNGIRIYESRARP